MRAEQVGVGARRRGILRRATWAVFGLAAAALLVGPSPAPGYPFGGAISFPSGTNPHGVIIADVSGDGRLDLVAANAGSNNVSVRRGAGDGTFGAPQTLAVGLAPKVVAAADVSGDGVVDLVTANQDASTVSVLRGTGGGNFAAAASYGACGRPHELGIADFNGDGRRDIAVPCWGGTVVSVLLNAGSGTFAAAVNYGAQVDPHSVATGDFNGDGRQDLAVANHGSASVSVLLGNGNGTFQTQVAYAVGTNPHAIRAGDFNGDSRLDLATANDGSDNVSVLLGTGTGTFGAATNFPTGRVPKGILVADVNADQRLDLVTSNTAGNYPSGANNPGGDEISVLIGNGSGSFAAPRQFTVGHTPFSVAAGDVDGNGLVDLATANWFGGDVSLLLNLPPGPLPAGFSDSIVLSGLTQPTAVRFASDGRVFVAEKSGLIKVFDGLNDPTPTLLADLSTKVHNYWDRGLLGLALDPSFPTAPYVYVLYTHDAAIGGTAPRWGTPGVLSDPCPTPPGPTTNGCVVSGRVSRLQVAGNVMTGSEQVLVEGWCQQFPSHTVGSLVFGADGMLYVSGGEGANFGTADYGQFGNPCGDPPGAAGTNLSPPTGEGGALRSQDLRTSGDPAGLNGAILRIDPSTGQAAPGNPNGGSADANARRIVSYGFRNPFRVTVKPGTNELWVADVGWDESEEIDVVDPTTLGNYGWPCYEGTVRQSAFDGLNLTLCENLYAQPGAVQQPRFTYAADAPVHAGDPCSFAAGSSISGIAYYASGNYPARYNNSVFFADYSRRCIWALIGGQANGAEAFATNVSGPVDLQIGPGGDLFYVDLDGGTVRRIQYATPAPPPTGTSYVSDLTWVSATNGWGPVERNMSNAELPAGDGGPITLNGVTFAKGLGVHAASDVVLALGGSCSALRATVGVDDEVGSLGSVRFAVFGDGVKLWESAVLTGSSASVPVDVDVTGRDLVRLSVSDGNGSIDYDHADWADARVVCAGGDTTPPTVASVSPAAGATGVAPDVKPTAVFSEPLSAGSVSAATFSVRKQGAATDVPGSVTYDGVARAIVLTPAAALEAGATYVGRVVGGASGVKDAAGNPLASDFTWSFTVAAGSNTAPTPVIASPSAGTTWAVGDTISFSGSATDQEDGSLPAARLSWALILHHCGTAGCHTHPIQSFDGVAGGSFTAPDHDYPSHLELRLTATDSSGQTGVRSLQLDPKTVTLSFVTSPAGLDVVVGSAAETAPFDRTVIVGSQNSISAPSPQTSGGQSYTFSSWSDGGAQSHTITAPTANRIYTATFTGAPASSTRYVSDLTWTSSTNGWGPVERDQSNGELNGGDGRTLTLNGTTYAKGIGAHAVSAVVLPVDGCSSFRATVGIDDEVGTLGSVGFRVLGDGVVLYSSPVVTGASAPVNVDVDVSGRASLRLEVTNGGDNIDYDHADWAEARLLCGGGGGDTTPPTVSSFTPAAGATGVAATVRPTATFSEAMTAGSVTASTVTLRKASDAADVAATVTYDAATRVATLAPAAALDAGGSYTMRVAGGPAGVKDAAGNPLAADHTWSFTVAAGPVRAFPSSVVIETGSAAGGNAASLAADDDNYYLVNSTTFGTRTTSWYGVVTGVPNSVSTLSVSYRGANSLTCTQSVAIWRWTTSSWVTLRSSSVGASETSILGLVPTGALADYVSGTSGNGDVRIRVRCTRSTNFVSRGEWMFLDYTP
jgi:glucose/arabinose dehydrogenase